MKIGAILVEGPDGDVSRLVSVDPAGGSVLDLRAAERVRLERRGATPEAARRVAASLFPGSVATAIAAGELFCEALARVVATSAGDGTQSMGAVRWLPAIDPPVMRDCMAFELHLVQSNARIGRGVPALHYELPAYYKCNPAGLVGHEQVIRWPAYTRSMDYELELGFVVGPGGRDLQPDEAGAHIFGVTILNDFSARDIQAREMRLGLGPAKGKDFASAVGPWITTRDELDLGDLEMVARVNGEEWSRGNSGSIMWSPAELLAYLSLGEELRPGELIGSGTLGGGCGYELGRELSPGDVVELEVTGIGLLRNRLGELETGGWTPTARTPSDPSRVETRVSGTRRSEVREGMP